MRVSATHLSSQSPDHEQALAARVFHLNRCSLAPRIFHFKRHAIVQALASRIFHPNHHSTEQVIGPRAFHLNRRNLATRIFHPNHCLIGQSLAPDHFFSKLRLAWSGLRYADCSMLHTSFWLQFKSWHPRAHQRPSDRSTWLVVTCRGGPARTCPVENLR